MTKKIPIHFNNEDLKEIEELIELCGISGVYGEIPKTLKLSITLAKSYIELLEKVIPAIPTDKLDLLFTSIKRLREKKCILL